MRDSCRTAGCNRPRAHQQVFCRYCLKNMLDIYVPEPESSQKIKILEHMATCSTCSTIVYGLMITKERARTLMVVGVRCGNCGSRLVQIEEVIGGLNSHVSLFVNDTTL